MRSRSVAPPRLVALCATALLTACNGSGFDLPRVTEVRVTDVAQVEGNDGTRTLTFQVNVDTPAIFTTEFNVTTIDGTATAGLDYVAVNDAVLEIPPGSVGGQVGITVLGDELFEADESFRLRISGTARHRPQVYEATGIIINDDLQQNMALDVAYEYDQLARLTTVRYSNGKSVHYTYDPAGNVLSATGQGD